MSEKNFFVSIGAHRLGFQQSLVHIDGRPYLNRFICYLWGWTVRLHKFYRGDDDRASHTHPFWYITFPFKSYVEKLYCRGEFLDYNVVKAWRFHYRPVDYEHIVVGRADGSTEPFWTFVVSSQRLQSWGFYPRRGLFVPWREFDDYWRNK